MTWDNQTGNLSEREDVYASLTETFAYDDLDRLTQSTVSGLSAQNVAYNSNGNISSKTGIGDYSYNAPYRLTTVENTAGNVSMNTQNVQYNAFNEPARITDLVYQQSTEGWRMDFTFGADFQRIMGALHYEEQPTEIREYYPDLGYECVIDVAANVRYHLYYESVQGKLVNLIVKEEDLLSTGGSGAFTSAAGAGYHYVYTDHLGSILSVTDDQGAVVATQNFDAWGRRRDPATWDYTGVPTTPIWLLRGFTGHEQLDELGLIHMNGRLYDPLLGRMLSPDNHVQSPHRTQGYNRYAYCYNNPLKYTDPSGEIVTWSIGNGGGSIGINGTPVKVPLGIGVNVGWQDGFSLGIYVEAGPRVGGTGLGAGATVSQSRNYNFKHNTWSLTNSAGAYASFLVFNASAGVSVTENMTAGETSFGWGVGAGVGISNQNGTAGIGLSVGYGSSGWSAGVGGYYDSSKSQVYNEPVMENSAGTGDLVASNDPNYFYDEQDAYSNSLFDDGKWPRRGQSIIIDERSNAVVLYNDGIDYSNNPIPLQGNGYDDKFRETFTFFGYAESYNKNPMQSKTMMNTINANNYSIVRHDGYRNLGGVVYTYVVFDNVRTIR